MNNNIFWYTKESGATGISLTKLYIFLTSKGIWQINLSGSWFLVEEKNHICQTIDSTHLSLLLLHHIRQNIKDDFEREPVENALRASISSIVSTNQLRLLDSKEIEFKTDTESSCFLYYNNQWIDIQAESLNSYSYSDLDGNIWKDKLLDRPNELLNSDRNELLERCVFAQFLWNVSSKKQERFDGICSMLGYLLHEYKDPRVPKAIVLMDEEISDSPNGGTGKGIIMTALKKMREVLVQDGKNFKWDQFAFQDVTHSTSILAFDDVPRNFNSEKLFSAMTEELIVVRKGKDRFRIPEKDTPKVLIITNYVIKGNGNSNLRRREEFELSKHYSMDHTPFDDFNHVFFSEWDEEQYNLFDNFMIQCIQLFLQRGIIPVQSINLSKKKIHAETCPEFVEFISYTKTNRRHNRNELMRKFEQEFPEISRERWYTNRQFIKWLQLYANHNGYEYTTGRFSGGDSYFEYKEEIVFTDEEKAKNEEIKRRLHPEEAGARNL